MLSFESDYNNGAHEKVLQALMDTNDLKLPGYGEDELCQRAKEKIKKACGRDDAQVEFIVGGTQTNMIVISTMLKDHEGVVAATTGHVNCHEAGAIEYTGHKVMELPQYLGKMKAEDLDSFVATFYGDANHEHMVYPGIVYISHPTEYGTLYSKEELKALHDVCGRWGIPLFLDGARLGYGLASYQTDVTLKDIAELTDVFYIGGTKVGALCGEAVVFTHGNRPGHFVNAIKKRGALLAKGRLLGAQFDALFTDDLYFKIGRHAIDCAEDLKKLIRDKKLPFFIDSPTNQQFVVLSNDRLEEISKDVRYGFWEKYDDTHTVVRFATSWATKQEDIEELARIL